MDLQTGLALIASVIGVADYFKDINPLYCKKRAEMEVYMNIFKEHLTKHLEDIPEENRQSPKNSIIWPAFESSIFYLEDEEYREMFAKLIASACDNRKNINSHHYFLNIIKQLDPKDAIILKSFCNDNSKQAITNICVKSKIGEEMTILTNHFFVLNKNTSSNPDAYSSCITNLKRLGIIEVSYLSKLVVSENYDIYEQHPVYLELKSFADKNGIAEIYLEKGIVDLTPLGKDFLKVCIE